MILSPRLRAELIAFADERAPQEAPGLISAPSGTSEGERDVSDLYTLWRAENVATEPFSSFLIGLEEQEELLRRIWSRNEELVGIFHSHPRSGPEPSQVDRVMAEFIQSARPRSAAPLTWVIVGRCRDCEGTGCWSDWNGEEGGAGSCGGCAETGMTFWVGALP